MNVPMDAMTTSDILKDATKVVAKIIGKPECLSECPFHLRYGNTLGLSVNGKLSSTIAEILQTKMSIESFCFYIKFYDAQQNGSGFWTYSKEEYFWMFCRGLLQGILVDC
ncbi:hypothetical protein K2173_020955 [Erythroxylum novogranatense]|uniref:L-dopachrome isomerase n=1 Tax=Erythroxylum novogranatense TaxID=1862640 RepID=A0AAV8TPU7_9ROSI|nr:hypothetical protein K2173_020955 [Erythroxylum novogranatense]